MQPFNLLLILFAVSLSLGGCQSLFSNQSAPSSLVNSPAEPKDNLTVVDASGTAIRLPNKPEKIVCLHLSCIDILAELEVIPMAVHHRLLDLARSPVYFGMAGQSIEPIAALGAEPNLEQLLKIKPDLIIGHLAQSESQREILKPIAPVYLLEVETQEDAVNNLRAIAEFLDKQVEAEAAIDRFQKKLDYYQENSPKNQTVLITNGVMGGFYIATQQSLVGETVAKLADYPWSISQRIPSAINWVTLSQEEILTIDPDVIFVLSPSRTQHFLDSLQKDSFWKELKAVKTQRIYELENELVGGLTTGTRGLSSLLDAMMPQLYPDSFPRPNSSAQS